MRYLGWALMLGLGGGALAAEPAAKPAVERLICCGAEEVFILPGDVVEPTAKNRLWRWRAEDSPEIPAAARGQFRTTDDCKPYDDRILITSSSGGVALIRREDKKCLFFTTVRNAHSACLLPGDRLAVASSFGGDEMLVFALTGETPGPEPLLRMPLKGAHGAVWDTARQRLWGLGSEALVLIALPGDEEKQELVVEQRWPLPTHGGHDLSPTKDAQGLWVTTDTHVYRFDKVSGEFTPFAPLAEARKVKSIDQHPATGKVVYHQADTTRDVWWSDQIRFLDPDRALRLPDERLYKVRWDAPRDAP